MSQNQLTVGSSGGVYGILMAFGMLYGDQELFMFPLPFTIKAKYVVIGLIFIALVGAFQDAGGIANVAHLGGALFGFIYLKVIPRRGLALATSDLPYLLGFSRRRKKREDPLESEETEKTV